MVAKSWTNWRNGAGELGLTAPSIVPRTGSRSVATHSATINPGMPTARNAACHPTSPIGPPIG